MTKTSFTTPATSTLQPPHASFSLLATKISDMNLTATPDPWCAEHNALHIPFAVLYSVIFVLGLVGNLVALWVFFYIHSKKNSVRVFLINVAFADLLLVVCLPFRILYHSHGDVWNLNPTLCKVVGNVFYMNMYMSITLLGLISVDRYLKMHRGSGTRHRLQSTRWSHALCAVVWILASALTLTYMISKNNRGEQNRCFHYRQLLNEKWKAYINIFLLVLFWLVFISLVVSYGKIAHRLLRTSQEKPDLPNTARYIRTAKKSFFILFLFTVCFVPYHMVRVFYIKTQITETSCYWRDVADKANEVSLLFSALNSCLDPVMYFLLSSSVRKEVLRLMSNLLCVRDLTVGSGSSSTNEGDGRTGKTDRGQTNRVFTSNVKETESADIGSNLDCEGSLKQ
ncbi:probable G-protein coupled receptor 34 [Seriola lalandi dorsalis]|uniref:Probable G-protein coupled receptor 34 n=1 Tax=Seriola lalandi dorsalis TaxID=1841481 RepID=A0A3B4XUY4_SERLL|nr:probable G-protein coupled receptor 34 [Seriola lalandi dorsalis]XP_023249230.1 probable G-protein coupled receptor 34 [Seriola lalandi dorsalis]